MKNGIVDRKSKCKPSEKTYSLGDSVFGHYGMKTEQHVWELSPEDTAIGTDSKQETKLLLFFPGTRR